MSRRRLEPGPLLAATHNPGKVRELIALLEPLGFSVTSAAELNLPEPEETEATFTGNAELKALAAARASGRVALADDSGMAVTALGGQPGIYSARWAGPEKDFRAAMERVERELAGNADRSAKFICVLSLAWPDGHCESFYGEIEGQLVWPPRGERGFGYDPMFVASGEGETFGEMDPDRKHAMSHRAVAFRKFEAWLGGT